MISRVVFCGVALLLAGCFPFAGGSKDTGTVAGIVTDKETGEPIFYVAVLLEGTVLGAMTDNDGKFTIKDVKPGTYNVRFSHVGYVTTALEGVVVTAGETARVTVQLTVSHAEM